MIDFELISLPISSLSSLSSLSSTNRTTASQGTLDLWVDMLKPEEFRKFKPFDIKPPPPEDYELRVVIWNTEGVKASIVPCGSLGLVDPPTV